MFDPDALSLIKTISPGSAITAKHVACIFPIISHVIFAFKQQVFPG